MRIRKATPEDGLPIIKFLATYFYAPYAEHFAPLNFEKGAAFVMALINGNGVLLAETDDGRICGTIGGYTDTYWWSDQSFIRDGWFFVAEFARGAGIGAALLTKFCEEAGRTGLPVQISIITGDELEKKDELMKRLGFRKIGGIYERK